MSRILTFVVVISGILRLTEPAASKGAGQTTEPRPNILFASPTTGPGRTPEPTATRSSRRRRSTASPRRRAVHPAFTAAPVVHPVPGRAPHGPGAAPA